MAAGDITLFEEFAENLGGGDHDFAADTLKFGIINGTDPVASQATPTWATYNAQEVGEYVGNYVAEGVTLTSGWAEASGTGTLQLTSFTLTQNASGFPDGGWGIIYNDTHGSDAAIAFMELSATDALDQTAGDIVIKFNGAASGSPGNALTIAAA